MVRAIACILLGALATVGAGAQSPNQSAVPPGGGLAPDPAQTFAENCAACHQADGKGIEGAFPALAGDSFVLGPASPSIHVVLDGRAGMPTFRADLTDAQIAAALTHVRTSWGNSARPVTAAEVAALRSGAGPKPEDKKPISAH